LNAFLETNTATLGAQDVSASMKCEYKNISLVTYDLGGQDKHRRRNLLNEHFEQSEPRGIVFVIDSANPSKIGEALDELHFVLGQFDEAFLLVMANKADIPSALNAADMTALLQLGKRAWVRSIHVFDFWQS
jgi:signal recognition particle receptor subunit beta